MSQAKKQDYVLGYQDNELQRLQYQSQLIGPLTEETFRRAGIGPGMKVLDVGCGVGDVSLLAAKLVGPTGSVTGVDQSPEGLEIGRKRAASEGFQNITFVETELSALSFDTKFDALVGRLVLLYMKDPAASIRNWARFLKPGGIVAFHEMVMTALRSDPPASIYDQTCARILETFHRAGNEKDMGTKLYSVFVAAGLPAPRLFLGGGVEGGPDSPVYAYISESARSLLPMMEQYGVCSAADLGLETLAIRMRDQVVAGGGVVVPPPMVGAWTRTAS